MTSPVLDRDLGFAQAVSTCTGEQVSGIVMASVLDQIERRRCQTNANSSQFSRDGNLLGRKMEPPLSQSGSAVGLEILSVF